MNEGCAQSIQSDMGLIEKYQQEIRELDRKINTQQAKLGGSGILAIQFCTQLVVVHILFIYLFSIWQLYSVFEGQKESLC